MHSNLIKNCVMSVQLINFALIFTKLWNCRSGDKLLAVLRAILVKAAGPLCRKQKKLKGLFLD